MGSHSQTRFDAMEKIKAIIKSDLMIWSVILTWFLSRLSIGSLDFSRKSLMNSERDYET